MYLKIICYVLFVSSIELIDAVFQRCDYLTLPNGKVKYYNRGRKVKFSCFKPYTLIGNARLDCEDGEWNGPLPVCASRGCESIPRIHHGTVTYSNNGAVAKLQCDTNFTLIDSSNIVVCEPSRRSSPPQWNYTNIPECQANSIIQFENCDFEPNDAKQCKWISKSGLFNWTLIASNPKETPYMPVDEYPSHDHTLGQIHAGHFLYLEAIFAPTKKWMDLMNTKMAPARFTSPLFPPITDNKLHCLIFYLYANGSHPGTVEVLVNEERIWKSGDSIGTEWHKIKIPIPELSTRFRITIEGKGKLGHFSGTAIDDVKIAIGEECLESLRADDNPHMTQTSTHAAETTTMTTTYDPVTITSTIQNSDTDPTTELTDQSTYTTQPPESLVVITETTPAAEQSSANHINLATDNQIPAADHTEVPPWIAASHFNFSANRLSAPTNHTMINAINNNAIVEEFNTSSKIDYTQIPSKGEILITDNNITYHDPNESKNDIIVEQGVPLNSSLYHRTVSTTGKSSTQQKKRDKKDNQTLIVERNSFVHSISLELGEEASISVSSTTHSPVSHDTVVESNDAKYEYDHEEEKNQYNVEEVANNLRHSGTKRLNGIVRLRTNVNKNDEINDNSSNLNHSKNSTNTDSKMIWILLVLCVGLTLLFITQGCRKYKSYRRKDESSIQFMNKSTGSMESPHKKDEFLALDCIPKNTT